MEKINQVIYYVPFRSQTVRILVKFNYMVINKQKATCLHIFILWELSYI